jgi:hypothetical protein
VSQTHEHDAWEPIDDGESGAATIPIAPGQQIDLYVENPNGDTVIRTADRNDLLARWRKIGRPGSPWYDEANVQVTQIEDNRIEVKVSMPPVWPGGDFGRSVLKFLEGGLKGGNPFDMLSSGRVGFDLQIELPREAIAAHRGSVRVRGANGDVRIEEVSGTIDVATANGDVTTVGTDGEFLIHAANGDLTFDRPVGSITARTISGDLRIRGGNLSRFILNTVNGDTAVETALTGDASRIEGVSGDVQLDLTLPAATGGTISVRGISGDARVEPPFRSVAKRTWRIGPGPEGGPSVAVKTVSGDLKARGKLATELNRLVDATGRLGREADRARDLATELNRQFDSAVPTIPAPPEPPTAPAPPAPPMEAADIPADPRLAILQEVERGEIDIDEAMRRLDSLA